jgi:hypothetical protein
VTHACSVCPAIFSIHITLRCYMPRCLQPIIFVWPPLLYAVGARNVSSAWKAINGVLAVAYMAVGVLGAVGAFYLIVQSARTYQLFADL